MSEQLGYVPIDREDLLARMGPAWDELQAAIASVEPRRLAEAPPAGGWTAKDHLCHVTTWLHVVLARIERGPEHALFGLDPAAHRSSDEEGLNEAARRLHRDRPIADVLADLRGAHGRVVAAIGSLSRTELERPTWAHAPHRGPLTENIHANAVDHLRHHAADIRDVLDRVG